MNAECMDINNYKQFIAGYEENSNNVEEYTPQITRDTISLFEFVRIVTSVAKYLYSLHDLSNYIEDDLNMIVNPCELALELLLKGKIDATIDRLGYEKVTFSKLKLNDKHINVLRKYFKEQNENIKEELSLYEII